MPIIFILFTALIVFAFYRGVASVPMGESWTVERFGKYIRTLEPGLSLIVPFADRIGKKIITAKRTYKIDQACRTSDNHQVPIRGSFTFEVDDVSKAAYAFKDFDGELNNMVHVTLKETLATIDHAQIKNDANALEARLQKALDVATDAMGVRVTRLDIDNL